jgi:membrane fusion protein, heavy metal efflux system
VRAEVAVGQTEVPLAVPAAALQELDEGGLSVFVEEAQGLVPRPVKVGRNDGRHAEILAGIAAGARVVGEGSFVLKAEQGKGGAEHDH